MGAARQRGHRRNDNPKQESGRSRLAVPLLACVAVGLVTATSAIAASDRQRAKFEFTTERPGKPSGLRLDIDYVNPDDRDAKPVAVRRVVETLARGSRIDTSVPDLCQASDAELIAQGESACPSDSRVGDGTIRIDTGVPGPERFIDADVVFLNNTDELIFVSTERDSGSRVVSRSQVDKRQIVNTAPPLPGAPPDGAALDEVHAELDRIVAGGRAYIRTPSNCPKDRRWTNKVHLTYSDGVTQKETTGNRCRR